jgi:hypothetical protein
MVRGQLNWFLGNVYEAGVDMPQLLAAVDGTLPLNGPPLVPSTGTCRLISDTPHSPLGFNCHGDESRACFAAVHHAHTWIRSRASAVF